MHNHTSAPRQKPSHSVCDTILNEKWSLFHQNRIHYESVADVENKCGCAFLVGTTCISRLKSCQQILVNAAFNRLPIFHDNGILVEQLFTGALNSTGIHPSLD
jgi:hypothetical protein